MLTPVFVYGTLKKGYGNNRILQNSVFKGCFYTEPRFSLYPVSPDGGFPVACRGKSHIVGEVYEIDLITLQRLDYLEGHPHHYRREEVEVLGYGKAFMYVYPHRRYGSHRSRKGISRKNRFHTWKGR